MRLQLVASGAVRHTGSDADADEDVDVDVERRLLLARPWSLARPDCRGMMTVVDVASVYVGMEPNRQRPALSGKVMWELRAMQCNAMQCGCGCRCGGSSQLGEQWLRRRMRMRRGVQGIETPRIDDNVQGEYGHTTDSNDYC